MTLPVRDGVGPSVILLPAMTGASAWPTLLDFLVERFPHVSRDDIMLRIQRGDVTDAKGAPILANSPYQPHQKLYYYRATTNEIPVPDQETIVFEDEWIVVADKPHFLAVTPGGRHLHETLLVRLKRKLGIDTLAPMHRIDRETAGLVVLTKKPETRGQYQALFQTKRIQKTYLAVSLVTPTNNAIPLPMTYRSHIVASTHFMRMREATPDEPIATEPNAEVYIRRIAADSTNALYQLIPTTGKKHQLRVQMAALGMPILYDQMYPDHLPDTVNDDFSRPLQLLAQSIAFSDPMTGQAREFSSARRLAHAPTHTPTHNRQR
jgi:tRNA pseudouridine32 synthase / 23S rRNA pseudouridine746 synthase